MTKEPIPTKLGNREVKIVKDDKQIDLAEILAEVITKRNYKEYVANCYKKPESTAL